jgi:hypothetical protein
MPTSSGHTVHELNFDETNLTFSGLQAIDYFEDGSLYLINTPGVSTRLQSGTIHHLLSNEQVPN